MKRSWAVALAYVVMMVSCAETDVSTVSAREGLTQAPDVHASLSQLPRVEVSAVGKTGLPAFLEGDLGTGSATGKALQLESREFVAALRGVAAPFRLAPAELRHVETVVDHLGFTHVRYAQVKNGLKVVGGDFSVHLDKGGRVYAAHGGARDGIAPAVAPRLTAEAARQAVLADSAGLTEPQVGAASLVYLLGSGGALTLAFEAEVAALRNGEPLRDRVYVDATSATVLARHPTIHSALNRSIYSAQGTYTTPGVLQRAEGNSPSADTVVNNNYNTLGTTYSCYSTLFGRDSYDNAGAALVSTIHYGTNLVNAYWTGSQMLYGDGDGVLSGNLANSMDVTAHELTHAVTDRTAGLIYSGESGGLNESMSDVFGNICEEFRDGYVSGNTWMVGEDVWTPGTAGDALRYMNDPRRDGISIDYYTDYSSGLDVHYSSGLGNLAFYLASQGGYHPRGRSAINVTAATITKARQIWYRGLTLYMSSNTSFAGARAALERAARDLYTPYETYSVASAWAAVGVGGATCNVSANATEGVSACALRCVPVTPLSGYNVCLNDCDCGNASTGRYCYFGPFSCSSTLLANPTPPTSQPLTFTGGTFTQVSGSAASFSFSTSSDRQVTVRTNWSIDYPSGPSVMRARLRLVIDGTVVGGDDSVPARGGSYAFARTVTLHTGNHSMRLEAVSTLQGGPPVTITLFVSPMTATLERQ